MYSDANFALLGTVATVQAGFPFRGAIRGVSGGSALAVQMKHVTPEHGIDWRAVTRTDLPGRRSADWLAAGDILFVARGPRFYATCVDEPPDRAVCSPHFFHLRVRPGARVLPPFLAWLINQPPVQRQLHQAAEGSNQRSIRRPVLEAVRLRIPSFVDQHRVVSLAQMARRERQLLQELMHNRARQLEALAETLSDLSYNQTP